MSRPWSLLLAVGVATTSLLAQGVTDSPRLLAHRYVEGNRLPTPHVSSDRKRAF